MNFICALLLLFMEEEAAFWMLSVIVEEITCVEGRSFYYQSDLKGVHVDDMVFAGTHIMRWCTRHTWRVA